jgi:hypothetical protein
MTFPLATAQSLVFVGKIDATIVFYNNSMENRKMGAKLDAWFFEVVTFNFGSIWQSSPLKPFSK